MTAGKMHKTTLQNGLRVVLERLPGSPRSAVCVHYGIGYRSEEPAREGFTHLFEHLMFRGSASLPPGRFFEHIHPLGGQANGTTHQDYTDYHQLVPAAALERALFSEADRMRAPVFTEETLAEQLHGIEEEIHQAVTARPYGGLPWPLLPGVVFERFANAHDGYGRMDRLREASVADCEAFFQAHYAPGNAVLTVVGDHDPDALLTLVERHFGDIPARPFTPPPELSEPDLTEDRWQTCTEPTVPAAALALGYRLPDPRRDMAGYLTHTVLAEMISQHGLDGLQAVSAGCGVFGPLDAVDPDLLVITALVPPMVPPWHAVADMTDRWATWADAPDLGQSQPQAVQRLITRHHREHASAYPRSRALGRLELLFGRAELLDEYPARLAEVGPGQVAASARRLGTAPKGVLVMAPGPTRTRPAPVPEPGSVQEPKGPSPAAAAPVSPAPAAARPLPPLGAQPAPHHGPRCQTTLTGGTVVLAVQDHRSPLVELRFRLPLGALGWQRPDAVDELVQLLARRSETAGRRIEATGGDFHLSTDGQWFDVTGYTAPGMTAAWLDQLTDLTAPVRGRLPEPDRPPRPHSPDAAMDTALRRHWLGGARPVAAPDNLGAVQRSVLGHGDAWLIAVGALDPERFAADAARALSDWPGASPTAVNVLPDHRDGLPAGGILALHDDASDDVRVALSAPEPAGDTDTAPRYLATALICTQYTSRMPERVLRADHAAPSLYAARDVCLDVPRASIRATLHQPGAAQGIAAVRDTLRAFQSAPITAAELAPIRDFCAAQLLGAFDTPATKADLLRDCLSAGRQADWAERLPVLLRETTAPEVSAACTALFPVDEMDLVVLGRPGPVTEACDQWRAL
ncbi:insulinase family protein [Streptomyces kronopolitis]